MKSLIVQEHLRARKGGMIKTINGYRPTIMPRGNSLSASFQNMAMVGSGTPAHKKTNEALSRVLKPLKFKY